MIHQLTNKRLLLNYDYKLECKFYYFLLFEKCELLFGTGLFICSIWLTRYWFECQISFAVSNRDFLWVNRSIGF